MIKLDATNRTAAVAEAMRRGLIPGRTDTGFFEQAKTGAEY